MANARVLIIVPTLGTRIDFLAQSLESITSQETPADILVVCPLEAVEARLLAKRHKAEILDDPGSLPKAINQGACHLQSPQEFISWLGDDDLLEPNSLATTVTLMDASPQAVLAFGACRYIDESGREIGISRAGRWARTLLSWGPDLIPQPGMLVRASSWSAVGGLDERLALAFDLDLLLKLKARGPFACTPQVISSFRWHRGSLTASNRSQNLRESEEVKRRYLGPKLRPLSWLWEGPVRLVMIVAAHELHRRTQSKSATKS